MVATQTNDPQTVEGQWIFSGKIHYFELQVRYQPMKHSYGKIICFQNFSFGKGL